VKHLHEEREQRWLCNKEAHLGEEINGLKQISTKARKAVHVIKAANTALTW
jgi:hypothetical protein